MDLDLFFTESLDQELDTDPVNIGQDTAQNPGEYPYRKSNITVPLS